jgi:PhnB protein
MTLEPHITFNGQCEAAFKFYERCLGGKIVTMLRWGNSPMATEVPAEWHEKICHATLTLGEDVLAGADVPSEQYQRPTSFQLLLGLDEPVEAERVFQALADKGTVTMPMRETFWSARYGILTDQFGIPWEINCQAHASEPVRQSGQWSQDSRNAPKDFAIQRPEG